MQRINYAKRAEWIFILMIVFTILPIVIFLCISVYYHEIYNTPRLQNAILDLNGYDLENDKVIPLDGEWEFYFDKWILSEGLLEDKPDYLVDVPKSWQRYNDKRMHNKGKASYRITIKNCQEGAELFANIENINSRYRLYMNGVLISGRGNMNVKGISKGYPTDELTHLESYEREVKVKGKEVELVLELVSNHVGGLYITPVLTDYDKFHEIKDLKNMLSSAIVGILIVLLGCFITLYWMKDKSLASLAMLCMDLLVFIKICFQSNYFYFFKKFIPYKEYLINLFFELIFLFLPIVFLLCVQQLVDIKINKKYLNRIFIYEILFVPIIAWMALSGNVQIKVYLCVLAYLPFIYIIRQLCKLVKNRVPHSLMVSGILLVLIVSVTASTVVKTGSLVMDISLFPPACFTISMLLQMALYIRRNLEIQEQAIMTENLQLKLKESEMQLMLSQIKPHFLYNTLIAIHMLCTEEPETAADTVLKFAAFLRTNMNFISSRKPIPFRKELEHIQNYLDIEKLRFQERLEIEYDIQTEDFSVPPLTIQPLVENGIRHGACKNINKGHLVLRTKKIEGGVCIEIIDNGPGFDSKKIVWESKEPHGIQNVYFRLNEINAKINFFSKTDEGCTVRVMIPKEETDESSADR